MFIYIDPMVCKPRCAAPKPSNPFCLDVPPGQGAEPSVQPPRHALGFHQPARALEHAHVLDPRPPVRCLLLHLMMRFWKLAQRDA